MEEMRMTKTKAFNDFVVNLPRLAHNLQPAYNKRQSWNIRS
jgi:hypothetical protein